MEYEIRMCLTEGSRVGKTGLASETASMENVISTIH